jgi:RND superfamily putative drug exporter
MLNGFKHQFAKRLTENWPLVIIGWIVLAGLLRWFSPAWNSITQDGDLQFLPATVSSRVGQQMLDDAFTNHRSRSRLVLILAREDEKLQSADLAFGLDLGRRFLHLAGIAEYRRWLDEDHPNLPLQLSDSKTGRSGSPIRQPTHVGNAKSDEQVSVAESYEILVTDSDGPPSEKTTAESSGRVERLNPLAELPFELRHAIELLDQAIELDQQRFEMLSRIKDVPAELLDDRLAIAYRDRAEVLTAIGESDKAADDLQIAELLDDTTLQATPLDRRDLGAGNHLVDVWTWQDDLLGSKLGADSENARMIMLQLNSEFIAASNIFLLNEIDTLVAKSRLDHADLMTAGLEFGVSGSAAVGGDMLRAAAGGVRQTELVTVALILIILTIIYRSPILVVIPLLTIGLSLFVSISVVALLAVDPNQPEAGGAFNVFSTTRIFVVVLLFGAGTDFCLFFIARCRETLEQVAKNDSGKSPKQIGKLDWQVKVTAVAESWSAVLGALLGSAITTIVGLSMMYFSDFGKFSSSGPIIAVCLGITIFVCVTFTPALLTGIGCNPLWRRAQRLAQKNSFGSAHTKSVNQSEADRGPSDSSTPQDDSPKWSDRFRKSLVSHPILGLLLSIFILGLPAVYGWVNRDDVTYDFANELSENASSRQGTDLVERYFNSRDASPLIVVLSTSRPFADDKTFRLAIDELRQNLYLEGVEAVRSITDPLGDFPPDRRMGLFNQQAWRRRLLENHSLTEQLYIATNEKYELSVARFDVLLNANAFSTSAEKVLRTVNDQIWTEVHSQDSAWYGSKFAITGTTSGIYDLKTITQADQRRIQMLVIVGVWTVLVVMLRRVFLSAYLVATVLLSYLTTLGLTHLFFNWCYPLEFHGLDWKVPLFLFVILVAVGQDYNVYLTTRVLEEQERHGPIRGLLKAMRSTGGIITQCGIVMAGTFISMTGGAVLHWLGSQGVPEWLIGSSDLPVLRGIVELGFALALGVLIDTFLVRSILVPSIFALTTRARLN